MPEAVYAEIRRQLETLNTQLHEMDMRFTTQHAMLAQRVDALLAATEEYKRLLELQSTVIARVDNQGRMLAMRTTELRTAVLDHDLVLQGSGKDLGVRIRLDRVEQTEGNRRWHLRTLWTAIISLVGAVVADRMRR